MRQIPRERTLDSTAAMLSEGYLFVPNRMRRMRTDIFETRLMLSKAICITGEEAAEFFYGGNRFTRRNAMPPTTLMSLQDYGSVQTLDDEAHRHRKAMFLSLMNADSMRQLGDRTDTEWRRAIDRWSRQRRVRLLDEMHGVLCRGACAWAGLPLSEEEAPKRTREFAAMIDGAGSMGPHNWRGLALRHSTEKWAQQAIEDVRSGRRTVPAGSAAAILASHCDTSGDPLPASIAAVELLNVLRPTVAVARYIIFAALALHYYPACARRVREGDEQYREWFVQEVRRTAPFFPFVAGRAREDLVWKGYSIPNGSWVILDLYGTNHDRRIWGDPEVFRPERFENWNSSPFNFIPQGGGSHAEGHRCAGEWVTIDLMKRAVGHLANSMTYRLPHQDLTVDLGRMPAQPRSGFIISDVRVPGTTAPPQRSNAVTNAAMMAAGLAVGVAGTMWIAAAASERSRRASDPLRSR